MPPQTITEPAPNLSFKIHCQVPPQPTPAPPSRPHIWKWKLSAASCHSSGFNASPIERLVRRQRETGCLAGRPRSGRPRVMSRRQERAIRPAHLRIRHRTATETAFDTVGTHNRRISPKTVQNRLRESDLHASRPYVGPPLTQARQLRCNSPCTQAISNITVEKSPF